MVPFGSSGADLLDLKSDLDKMLFSNNRYLAVAKINADAKAQLIKKYMIHKEISLETYERIEESHSMIQ